MEDFQGFADEGVVLEFLHGIGRNRLGRRGGEIGGLDDEAVAEFALDRVGAARELGEEFLEEAAVVWAE